MKKYIDNFLLLVQFLTRIPVNKSLPCENENFRKAAIFFPVIGLIIGGTQWIVAYLLCKVLPVNIVTVFVIIVSILITGALHLDGWGDVFDGFFSFKGGKEKIIEVMKDSRIGTYACVAIICNFLLKDACISTLLYKNMATAIIVAPVMSKWCVVFISYVGKNAKKTGTGNIFIGNMDIKRVIISLIITIGILCPLVGIVNFLIIAICDIIVTILINKFSKKYIGGLTGDTLGFANEAIEIVTLTILVAINF